MKTSHGSTEQASLKLKRVSIDTNYENVVYLHKECSIYRAEGFQALALIEIFTGVSKVPIAVRIPERANKISTEILYCHNG